MQERRRNEAGRGPRGGPDPNRGPNGDQLRSDPKRDPGAYIGRMPERAAETIPGGVGPKDVRVAAVGTQPGPVRDETPPSGGGKPPEGHREGESATDDRVREAGQNR